MAKDPSTEFASEPTSEVAGHPSHPTDASGAQWFGHPRGLSTLFFTEMWERFSYYGMRAILMLFMTAVATGTANPGLGFDVGKASAIYGLFTSMVYLLALPGGWVADQIWGQRQAVFVGGVFIALGNLSLAVPGTLAFFYLGLFLIIVGTGLLKPNVSTIVGALYPEGGARRDAGFSIFYMGINIGAWIAPFIVGYFGEQVNWHLGFAASGVGMVLGLIQYRFGLKYLGTAGELATGDAPDVVRAKARRFYLTVGAVTAVIALFVAMALLGVFTVTLQAVATWLGYAVVALVFIYFIYLWIAGGYSSVEKKRLGVILWLFILAAVFFAGFEQAGSSLNLFARDLTERTFFGWEVPASWFQAINPIFIISMAPVFGAMWVWLDRRGANPSIPVKFALGLLGLAGGFFVIMWGAANSNPADPANPTWLIVTYFLFTCGELALSPVGLSSITKLSPKDRVGQMMGIWFIGAALGNLFAGLVAGELEQMSMEALFRSVTIFVGVAGVLALAASPFIKRLTGGVK